MKTTIEGLPPTHGSDSFRLTNMQHALGLGQNLSLLLSVVRPSDFAAASSRYAGVFFLPWSRIAI